MASKHKEDTMKSDLEKSIKKVRKALKQTTYDEKKMQLRQELKQLKDALLHQGLSKERVS